MFNVTTTADQADAGACGPGDAGCSLREAIVAANTAPSDDTVVVPAGNYVLTRTGSGENNGLVGDLDVKPNGKLTIVGAGARTTVIDANQIDRVIDVLDDSVMDVSGVTITGGFAPGQFGGGVSVSGGGSSTLTTVTVTDAAVVGNEADQGGGLENDRSADLTLTRTTVSGNKADKTGGGIQNVPVVGTATLHVTNSTISDNTQSSPTDPSSFEYGGGGITNVGAVFLDHVTMTGNKAAAIGGGIQQNSGTVTVKNSIVSSNSASSAGTANCDSPVASNGFNLEQGATCGFTQATDVSGDPKLGSLANNGGPTQTNALGSGSAALDVADPIGCPAIDQRGITRPQGAGCEIGALERELTDLSLTLADSPDPV
ncbi:MAG: hypothetical protein QOD53_749, partial [Thermoleophilaceae bacterium]|nr:hypothetical protein [Thermoleophilaceae bacterium]